MSAPEARFVVVESSATFRYPDGRDTGCRIGYLVAETEAIAELEAVGFRVLLVTPDELAAQIMVAELCGMTHGDMIDKKRLFVSHAEQEKTNR